MQACRLFAQVEAFWRIPVFKTPFLKYHEAIITAIFRSLRGKYALEFIRAFAIFTVGFCHIGLMIVIFKKNNYIFRYLENAIAFYIAVSYQLAEAAKD